MDRSDLSQPAAGREVGLGHAPDAPAGGLARFEVVLVSYRSRRHVEDLLSGWPADLHVAVVDNSDDVDGVSSVLKGRPNARLVEGGGQGFARAANLGAFSSEAEFVVFVNPDCRPSVDDMLALVEGLANDPRAWAHAATVTGADGLVEPGVGGWEPSVSRVAVQAFGLDGIWPTRGLFARPKLGERVDVDWTTGTCMAVRTRQFADAGGFDETFYVYMEDVAFGQKGRDHDLRPVLRPDVTVRHAAGSSGAPSAEMQRLRGASFSWYVAGSTDRLRGGLMRATFITGALARAAVLLARRDRSEARLALAFAIGLVTRRAFVGGSEVAERRYRDLHPDR